MNTDGNYEHSFVHFNDISSSNSYQKQLLLVETLVSRGLVLAPLAHILCAQNTSLITQVVSGQSAFFVPPHS